MAEFVASSSPRRRAVLEPDVFTLKQHSNVAHSLSTLEIWAETGLSLLILCAINYLQYCDVMR